jgi:hypothetical protein
MLLLLKILNLYLTQRSMWLLVLSVRPTERSELMIGAAPGFGLKGMTIDQPHLCIDGAIALLRVLKETNQKPRVIVTSSMGIGKDHANLPFVMRVRYLNHSKGKD